MARSVSPTASLRIASVFVAFIVAFALVATITPEAHALKATAGTGTSKAVYTYNKSTGKAVYKKCKAAGKTANIPATVEIKGKTYAVNGIASKAFSKSKVKTITVRTKKLAKSRVKNALKNSRVATVKVKVGTTPANNKYAAKYKKCFTQANAGKKATVKSVKVKASAAQKLKIAKAFAKAYYTHWTFKNGTFATVNAEKAISYYLASNCTRDEGVLDAAPFCQSTDATAQSNGLYIVKVGAYYTQEEVTQAIWNANFAGKKPIETELRIVLNKYGLVTSLVA